MPKYKVVQDINSGQYPVGSMIDLAEDEAAKIPWAVELKESGDASQEKPRETVAQAHKPSSAPRDEGSSRKGTASRSKGTARAHS